MSTLKLFNIYHSFLLKKWYLLLYIFLVLVALLGSIFVLQATTQKSSDFRIGLVDQDKTQETKLILNGVSQGAQLGQHVRLKQYDQSQAHALLKEKKLDGYYVFEKGMTKAFYKTGQLPISVYTYDKHSVKSVVIYQLTDSVYQRLMRSMGGGLTYNALAVKPSEDDTFKLLTDMLFTGLNRTGAFDHQAVHVYDGARYYLVTGYLASIFIVFLSLFSILKMNQQQQLKSRLHMYHFAFEKLTFIRGLFTLFYTVLWATFGFMAIQHFVPIAFKTYNLPTVIQYLFVYITLIAMLCILIDIVATQWMHYILTILMSLMVIVFSGMLVPTIYFKNIAGGIFAAQPFSLVTNQMLEVILNNYILDTHPAFYVVYACVVIGFVGVLIRRYVR